MQNSRKRDVKHILDIDPPGDAAQGMHGERRSSAASSGQFCRSETRERRDAILQRAAVPSAGDDRAHFPAPNARRLPRLKRARRFSIPSPVLTESGSIPAGGLSPWGSRSILLAISKASASMSARSASSGAGCLASSTTSFRSAAAARARARRTPSSSTRRGLAQARRVREHHGIALEIERDFDHVAGRAGHRRGDRDLAPRQRVEQRSISRHWAAPECPSRSRRAAARRAAPRPVARRSRRRAPAASARACHVPLGRSSSGKSIAASSRAWTAKAAARHAS